LIPALPHVFHLDVNSCQANRLDPQGKQELVWKDTVLIPADEPVNILSRYLDDRGPRNILISAGCGEGDPLAWPERRRPIGQGTCDFWRFPARDPLFCIAMALITKISE